NVRSEMNSASSHQFEGPGFEIEDFETAVGDPVTGASKLQTMFRNGVADEREGLEVLKRDANGFVFQGFRVVAATTFDARFGGFKKVDPVIEERTGIARLLAQGRRYTAALCMAQHQYGFHVELVDRKLDRRAGAVIAKLPVLA